jgi:5-methylcytosine-specific restriction endonuclease McrA
MKRTESRKRTPWDEVSDLTPTQEFLREHYAAHYSERHRTLDESGEADMINSYIPARCPYCSEEKFRKSGRTKSGVQRYLCDGCGKTFLPTTDTIFDEHRVSISEWMEYCLNLFRHVSITVDSWNNKNAFTTSRYWLQKLFLTLETVQNGVVLSEAVWLDETFYRVRSEDIECNEEGKKLRGLSNNQICIGVATDKKNTIFVVEGTGKPSQKKTFEAFGKHIERGATLIHDRESSHAKLVRELELKSVAYASSDLKGLPDKDNPMNPVNRVHAILKLFLNTHSSFNRENMQSYLNLFAFVSNPPVDLLEKVELIIKTAFDNPKSLRYRDYFSVSTVVLDEF